MSLTRRPNATIDRLILLDELKAAIAESKKHSAPGLESVTYKLLNNVGYDCLASLLKHLNSKWASSPLPPSWKTAEVQLIPKPGKSPLVDNLRPICLISCVEMGSKGSSSTGYRNISMKTSSCPHPCSASEKNLGTQDAHLQLKELVLIQGTRHSPRAILALDLKGSFDNVTHDNILAALTTTD